MYPHGVHAPTPSIRGVHPEERYKNMGTLALL